MSTTSSSSSSTSTRRSRLIALGCAAAAVLLDPTAEAFTPATATSQQKQKSSREHNVAEGGTGSAAGAARGRASARGAVAGGRSAASAAAAASSSNNPFRGSLNGRRPRRRPAEVESPSDDFALRMGNSIQTDMEHDIDIDDDMQSDNVDVDQHHGPRGAVNNGQQHSPDGSNSNNSASSPMSEESHSTQQINERRKFLHGMLATTVAGFTAAAVPTTSDSESTSPAIANAYELAYPLELQSTPINELETPANSLSKLKEERLSNKKAKLASTKSELLNDPLGLDTQSLMANNNLGLTVAGASTWALALWLASGSRSNPLVTPLANVLYDSEEEPWLADRNDGYFADPPPAFVAVLSAVFVFLGVVLDRSVYFLADGDAEVSLQLAGVSAIGGAVWEVGRLAAREKAPTREEYERDALLKEEFEEFATRRLVVGRGSCHRSDVISAFRRFNPKYRVADNERYPLADIEIERMLRAWNREMGSKSEMSAAGFFAGVSVDAEADAFAPR